MAAKCHWHELWVGWSWRSTEPAEGLEISKCW
jgi:hypothetical protein